MIALVTTLWIMIFFFAVVDMQRGWTRAVIATSGLVLSLFAINQFAPFLFDALGHFDQTFDDTIWRRQIFILASIQIIIGFFSYAGPAISGKLSTRLKIRDNIQDKILGLMVGAVNGYLAVGTLISFLEYRLTQEGWVTTAPAPYPFSSEVLVRVPSVDAISQWLPIPILTSNTYVLPILLVLVFLFVLVVML
jgi:uncharacterized membrane protein required for colicin V production